MTRITRFFIRAPIGLYRLRLGGLLGKRFLLLDHRGRKSGLPRRAVLEVVEIDDSATPIVVSGFGEESDWFRNVTANPQVAFTLGRRRVDATAQRLDHDDGVEVFDRYRTNHPRAAKAIGNKIGVSLVEDLEAAADKLPLFRLVPQA